MDFLCVCETSNFAKVFSSSNHQLAPHTGTGGPWTEEQRAGCLALTLPRGEKEGENVNIV